MDMKLPLPPKPTLLPNAALESGLANESNDNVELSFNANEPIV